MDKGILRNSIAYQQLIQEIAKRTTGNHIQVQLANTKAKRPLQNKTILILAWFRCLSGGGLHEHIRDLVNAVKAYGGHPVVVCPASVFSAELLEQAIDVIETDYQDIDLSNKIIEKYSNISLIHAHPGAGKKIAIEIAEKIKVPLIFTVHSKWNGNIDKDSHYFSAIIGVSDYICNELRKKLPLARSKIIMIPNGVDQSVFSLEGHVFAKENYAVYASRIEKDKAEGLNLLKDCWQKQVQGELPGFKWFIAGEGALLEELKSQASEIFGDSQTSVIFLGWLNREQLATLLRGASVSLTAGRVCLESLASGCPAVAVGAEKQIIIKDWYSFKNAAYSNFGEFGSGEVSDSDDDVMQFLADIFSYLPGWTINPAILNYINESLSLESVAKKIIDTYMVTITEYKT